MQLGGLFVEESNLFRFLKDFDLTSKSASLLKNVLDFELRNDLPQRKLVELGQVIGRIVSSDMVISMGEKGYREDLINNGLNMLHQEIKSLVAGFNISNITKVVEDYKQDSSWLKLVKAGR